MRLGSTKTGELGFLYPVVVRFVELSFEACLDLLDSL